MGDVRGWSQRVEEFTRVFTGFEKLFPRVQRQPSKVHDDIQHVHNIMRNFMMLGGRLRAIQNTDALAVGINELELEEPALGIIQFPITLLVTNPDAASRDVILYVTPTGSTPIDSWGNWTLVSGNQIAVARHTSVPAAGYKLFPALPVTRGTQLRVTMNGMTGGNNALINYLCVEVDGTTCDLADFLHYGPNMIGNHVNF